MSANSGLRVQELFTNYGNSFDSPQELTSKGFDYAKNNVFNVALCSKLLPKGHFEIPTALRAPIESASNVENPTEGVYKYHVPIDATKTLFVNSNRHIVRRSANSIFKLIIPSYSASSRDKPEIVITSKGDKYYCGEGYILDSEYRVLFMTVLKGERYEESLTNEFTEGKVYVHPKVFLSTNLVEKGIVKTLIPLILSSKFVISRSSFGKVFDVPFTPKIIVEDVSSNFIRTPSNHTTDPLTNNYINDFLIYNLDDILRLAKLA